jgi:hypothetical protein
MLEAAPALTATMLLEEIQRRHLGQYWTYYHAPAAYPASAPPESEAANPVAGAAHRDLLGHALEVLIEFAAANFAGAYPGPALLRT